MGRSERRESFEVGHRTQEVEECGGAGEDPGGGRSRNDLSEKDAGGDGRKT